MRQWQPSILQECVKKRIHENISVRKWFAILSGYLKPGVRLASWNMDDVILFPVCCHCLDSLFICKFATVQPVFPLCFVPSLYLILCSCAFYDFLKHFEKPSICCQPIKNRIHIDAIDWFHFQFSVDDMFRCMWCALAGERAIFIAAAYILLSTGSNLENSGNSTSLSHAATSIEQLGPVI